MTDERMLDFNPHFMAVYYALNVLVLVALTSVMKKIFKRPRPAMPDYSDLNCPHRRSFDLRTNETNCSFPSGDSA